MHINKTDPFNSLVLRRSYRHPITKKVCKQNLVDLTGWGMLALNRLETLLKFYRLPMLRPKARKWLLDFFVEKHQQGRLTDHEFVRLQTIIYPVFGELKAPKLSTARREPAPLMTIEECWKKYHEPWLLNQVQMVEIFAEHVRN